MRIKNVLDLAGFNTFPAFTSIHLDEDFQTLFMELNKAIMAFNDVQNQSALATHNTRMQTLNLAEKGIIRFIFRQMQTLNPVDFQRTDDVTLILQELRVKITETPSLMDTLRNLLSNKHVEPLNRILQESSLTFERGNTGNRYQEEMKELASFIFIKGGASLYKSLAQISSFPSVHEVKKNLYDIYPYIRDGQIYAKELKEFLVARNLKLVVGLGIDDTRVKRNVTYDKQTSSIVGLRCPINQTGMPDTSMFIIKKPSDVVKLVKTHPMAKFIEVVIAIPFEKSKF